MYHFSIIEPFNLNWKYVAPKDFGTLEYFLKPGLSVELSNISNGPSKFLIGSFLADGNFPSKFANEILPARSSERIVQAFTKEEVSVFFSPKDAEELKELFAKEEFICRTVKVKSAEHGTDLFALPPDEFALVMDFFSEVDVQQTADVKASREIFEDLRTSAEREIQHRVTNEQRATILGGRTKDMEKKMKIKAYVGSAFVLFSGVTNFVAKKLKDKGFAGAVSAICLKIVSSVTGIFGIKLLGNAIETYAEGMI